MNVLHEWCLFIFKNTSIFEWEEVLVEHLLKSKKRLQYYNFYDQLNIK